MEGFRAHLGEFVLDQLLARRSVIEPCGIPEIIEAIEPHLGDHFERRRIEFAMRWPGVAAEHNLRLDVDQVGDIAADSRTMEQHDFRVMMQEAVAESGAIASRLARYQRQDLSRLDGLFTHRATPPGRSFRSKPVPPSNTKTRAAIP